MRASQVAQWVKNPPAMQETQKMWVWSPGWEDPWRMKLQTNPVFLPGKSHGQRSLAGYSPRGHKELNTTKANEHLLGLITGNIVFTHLHSWFLSVCFCFLSGKDNAGRRDTLWAPTSGECPPSPLQIKKTEIYFLARIWYFRSYPEVPLVGNLDHCWDKQLRITILNNKWWEALSLSQGQALTQPWKWRVFTSLGASACECAHIWITRTGHQAQGRNVLGGFLKPVSP